MNQALKEYIERYDSEEFVFSSNIWYGQIAIFRLLEKSKMEKLKNATSEYCDYLCNNIEFIDIVDIETIKLDDDLSVFTIVDDSQPIKLKIGDIIEKDIYVTTKFEKLYNKYSVSVEIKQPFFTECMREVKVPSFTCEISDHMPNGVHYIKQWDCYGNILAVYRIEDKKLNGPQELRSDKSGMITARNNKCYGKIDVFFHYGMTKCYGKINIYTRYKRMDGFICDDTFTGTYEGINRNRNVKVVCVNSEVVKFA